jgi:hypothetical protein
LFPIAFIFSCFESGETSPDFTALIKQAGELPGFNWRKCGSGAAKIKYQGLLRERCD